MQMLGNECITCLTFVPPSSSFCLVYRLWLDSFLPEYLHASALTVSDRVSRVAACRPSMPGSMVHQVWSANLAEPAVAHTGDVSLAVAIVVQGRVNQSKHFTRKKS